MIMEMKVKVKVRPKGNDKIRRSESVWVDALWLVRVCHRLVHDGKEGSIRERLVYVLGD